MHHAKEEVAAEQLSLDDPKVVGLPIRIMLDNGSPASIPPAVLVGVGDKKARYKKWLDRAFTDDTGLLRYLAFIYKTIKERSNVELICACKPHKADRHYHLSAVREWLEENHEALDSLLPYLFDKSAPADTDASAQEPKKADAITATATTAGQAIAQGLITSEDFAQMTAIIDSDQATSQPQNGLIKIIPFYTAEDADQFVDPTLIQPYTVTVNSVSIVTAPIAIGKKVNILALSETESMLTNGAVSSTNMLDPMIALQNVYVKVGDDILRINVSNLPLSSFGFSTPGDYRAETLNFRSAAAFLNKNSVRADGSALTTLADVVTNDFVVYLKLDLTGTVNIETGELQVFGNPTSIHSIQDSSGTLLGWEDHPANAIVATYNTAQVIGYDVLAYRYAPNCQQPGQYIDTDQTSD